MTTTQLFFALLSSLTIIGGLFLTILLKYIDAKTNGTDKNVDLKTTFLDSKVNTLNIKLDGVEQRLEKRMDTGFKSLESKIDTLVQYMVDHESRISKLEERTKDK